MHARRPGLAAGPSRGRGYALIAVLFAALALFGSPGRAGAQVPELSPPLIHVQPAYGDPANLHAVSCTSAAFCVAVDHDGNALTSTDPASGHSWSAANVDGIEDLTSVSCPSARLCVATDAAGDVIVSRQPSARAPKWIVRHADDATSDLTAVYPSDFLTSVSCPSTALCVAVDDRGNVVESTDPGGSAPAWVTINVDGANYLSGVSCASASLCTAVDLAGNAVVSTNPTGGPAAWQVFSLEGMLGALGSFPGRLTGAFLSGISCPSQSLCVAVDSSGDIVSSTDPAGGSSAWTASPADGAGLLGAVSCASLSLCAAVDEHGNILVSTSPAGGAQAWHSTRVDETSPLDSVSCAATRCVAVDLNGGVTSSAGPAAAGGGWGPVVDVDREGSLACFGASAMDTVNPCHNPALSSAVIPVPGEAQITPNAPCTVVEKLDIAEVCAFGVPPAAATATVALLGDSHAQHWRAALEVVAQAKGWQAASVTQSGCPFSAGPLTITGQARKYCRRMMLRDVVDWLRSQPQITTVFVSESQLSVPQGPGTRAADVAGYIKAWEALPPSVKHIIVIRDTPRMRGSTLPCVEAQVESRRPHPGTACAVPRDQALEPDPAVIAASEVHTGRVSVIDLTSFICDSRLCYPVVGGALAYKDFQHLSEVFSTTLGPFLLKAVDQLMTRWH